jgi:hypothetical protein
MGMFVEIRKHRCVNLVVAARLRAEDGTHSTRRRGDLLRLVAADVVGTLLLLYRDRSPAAGEQGNLVLLRIKHADLVSAELEKDFVPEFLNRSSSRSWCVAWLACLTHGQ